VRVITAFLTSDKWMVQVAACEALADMGLEVSGGDGVMEGLIHCLKSSVWCVRANACKTLGRIVHIPLTDAEMLVELIACVFDAQEPVRIAASEVVTQLTGVGTLGMEIVVDVHRKRLIVSQGGKPFCKIAFPRPTPALLTLTLASPSYSEERPVGDWMVELT
jgi:hypothetical protein